MSESPAARRFKLRTLDERAWLICEVGEDDRASRTVAHLTMTDDDNVEVVWSHSIPLPASYGSAGDAPGAYGDVVGRSHRFDQAHSHPAHATAQRRRVTWRPSRL